MGASRRLVSRYRFAVGVEGRGELAVEAAGDLMTPVALCIEQEDRVVTVLEAWRIGEPAAVGRPARLEIRQAAVEHPQPLVDVGESLRVEVEDPGLHRLIDERQLLAVGRPVGRVAEALTHRGEAPRVAATVCCANRQLVLARLVAEAGDPPAVGRPSRSTVGGARAAGDVADDAVLGGHREQVTTRFDDHALARRRDVGARDQAGNALGARLEGGAVGDDVDLDLMQASAQKHPWLGSQERVREQPLQNSQLARVSRCRRAPGVRVRMYRCVAGTSLTAKDLVPSNGNEAGCSPQSGFRTAPGEAVISRLGSLPRSPR